MTFDSTGSADILLATVLSFYVGSMWNSGLDNNTRCCRLCVRLTWRGSGQKHRHGRTQLPLVVKKRKMCRCATCPATAVTIVSVLMDLRNAANESMRSVDCVQLCKTLLYISAVAL